MGIYCQRPHKNGTKCNIFCQNGDHLTWGYIAKGPTWKGTICNIFLPKWGPLNMGIAKGPTWKGTICNIFLPKWVSDSYPAFFLPIGMTSNKNFWKCNNCKWEMQMFVNSGTRGNKTGLLCSLSAFPSFIKPGTRQTGLTGRFQKSFDMNGWHFLRKGEKS